MTRDVRTLTGPPGIAAQYLRAVLPKGRGNGVIPPGALGLRAAPVDAARLRTYARVCGFEDPAATGRMPATFPHITAFPLAMELMTARAFPYPVLGLVHLTNRIEQLRPIGAEEPLAYEVWCEQPVPHAKGVTFDVRGEARAAGEGEPLWREVSTYLVRGRGTGERAAPHEEFDLAAPELETVWRLPESLGRGYASVSGDRNPIHLHALTAKLFGFPRAIAHGMWSKARALADLERAGLLPAAYAVGIDFRAPIPLPGETRLRAVRAGKGVRFAVTAEREQLRGEVTAL
ncbi:MaoC family dehydratase [Streptomyces polyrhachis]|uniref:MaoC family dehydratase n=1 Tax=Streptomyces polyrhachis TaxID=1282885 RepID=A0ABW2GHV2_9ACTN